MNAKEYIESGLLELYVAGVLSEKENQEIYKAMQEHVDVRKEVLNIEAAIVQLTAAGAQSDSAKLFTGVKQKIGGNDNVVQMSNAGSKWLTYSGWAAAVVMAIGMFFMITQNNGLKEDLQTAQTEQQALEDQIAKANTDLEEKDKLMAILRDQSILSVPLDGQAVYPTAFAKVYWDKTSENIYLDAQGLPDPPEGKVYQVWSLTLDPLTPTSLGVIDQFTADANKIFTIENPNASEAFGITLEPTGGSDSPTLEQLYTLGVVEA